MRLTELTQRAVRIPLVAVLMIAACSRQAPPETPAPVETPPPFVRAPDPPIVERAERRELVLLGTTDVHNRLYPYDYYTRSEVGYGLARLKPIIDSVRAANGGRTYLFDSGDLLQGNPLGFVYAKQYADKPNPVIRAMNLLHYDASAIGNHEYNYGLEHLNRALAQARFPFLSANTFTHGTDKHAYPAFTLIKHGVRPGDTITIGVTANTPPGVHVWDRAHVQGKLEFREIVGSIKPVVETMKARGADLVVILSHGSFKGTTYDTVTTRLPAENAMERVAREVPGVDVIFLGHSHQEIADTTINGVLFTQAGEWAKALSEARITMERVTDNQWRAVEKHGRLHKPNPVRADTAFLDSLRWEHERAVQYVASVVGRATSAMPAREGRTRDVAVADFINEVQRARTGADLSSTAVFRLNSALPAGNITVADVAGLYNYDNTLKAIRITGAQLKAYLEQSAQYFRGWPADGSVINPNHRGYNYDVVSGVDYTIDLSKPAGQRITALKFKGAPVTPEQSFTMAMNNYRQSGGGGFGMLAGAPVVYDKQEGLRELLIEEIQRKRTIRPADYLRLNWRIVPVEAARAAQAELAREDVATAAPPAKRLRVIGMNDFHGRLQSEVYSWSEGRRVGGAAAFTSYIKHERAGFDGPTILLDGGDVMQGTPISNLTQGRSSVDFFNRLGVDASAIGNHEYDWSIPVLRDRIQQARFPWLSANTVVAGSDTLPSWLRPWTMIERSGVKVGVIGLTTEETPQETKGINVRTLRFLNGAQLINKWVPELRRRGADFVIVTAHSGVVCERDGSNCRDEMINWARQVTNKPDLIVAGHTHQIINTVENGIRIVEGWDYSKKYSVVDLEKTADGRTTVWVRGQPTTFVDQVTPDSVMAALVARYERQIGPTVNRVIAELPTALRKQGGEYALGHLIADAQRAAGDAQVAIMNNGGIRTDLEAGDLTWGELYQLQPFANRLVRVRLTGEQLKQVIEHIVQGRTPGMHVSGILVDYDSLGTAGSKVQRMALADGTAIEPQKTYTVIVNDFLAGGGDGLTILQQAPQTDLGIVDLDALIDYVQRKPLVIPNEDRLRVVRRQG